MFLKLSVCTLVMGYAGKSCFHSGSVVHSGHTSGVGVPSSLRRVGE